jgi:citronellol/citronellal dehydrogenase
MRVLSIEWARYGLLLNAVAAGYIGTDTFATKYPERFVDAAAGNVPLGRVGRPEEIASLVAHLASPAGDYTTGTVLTVDGGRDNHLGAWPPPGEVDANGEPLVEQRAVKRR